MDTIVSAQLPEGGFALGGSDMDVDITAMALQALAPYQAQYPEVIDAALNALSAAQLPDGGFESWGAQSSESCAQVLLALTALDIDPETDERFQKADGNVIDALLAFRLNGFAHEKDGPLDAMACEQAMQALTAMELRQQGEGRFFDLTAAHPVQLETTPDTDTETPAESGGSFPVLPVVLIVIAIAAVALVLILKKREKKA